MSAHFARCVFAPLPNLWQKRVGQSGVWMWWASFHHSGRIWSFCSTRWCLCLFKKADVHVDHATDKLFVVASLIKNEKPMSLKTASGWSHLQDDRFLDWELWGVWLVHCLMPVVFLTGLVPSGMSPGCSAAVSRKLMFAHKTRWSLRRAESARLIGPE